MMRRLSEAYKEKLEELISIPRGKVVWTIGYEKLRWEDFVRLLKGNGIDYLVDVRLRNFSMRPEYRGKSLAEGLAKEGIGYMHMPEFGNPYKNTDWHELFTQRMFSLEEAFFQRLRSLLEKHSVVLLCYERHPLECHRSIVAGELVKRGYVDMWRDIRVDDSFWSGSLLEGVTLYEPI